MWGFNQKGIMLLEKLVDSLAGDVIFTCKISNGHNPEDKVGNFHEG